ncbi:Riboflavin synthase [Chlamydiales bacterium SCGC AG-110-M15]|nr:Riboflavin synthase [Chlamydiales bacterium SCGC AG-110-M15]
MFSGIIEKLGRVISAAHTADGKRLIIEMPDLTPKPKIGDSIAINGCCLTVVEINNVQYTFDVTPETLRVTTLDYLYEGDQVNLERALCLGDSLDGHLVQGHVDSVTEVLSLEEELGASLKLTVKVPEHLRHYLIHKGSITVDGVSLTIASLDDISFSIALIPHTAVVTNLGNKKAGDLVNIEVDLFAKYAERMLSVRLDHITEKV